MGPQLPRILRGEAGAVAMGRIADFDVKARAGQAMPGQVDARRGFESMYEQGVRDLLYGTGRETFEAVKMLRAAGAAAPGARERRRSIRAAASARACSRSPSSSAPTWASRWPSPTWAAGTRMPAQGNERGQLANRLTDFAQGLAALDRDLGDRMEDVVVLTMSEFGRTVRENGNRGTDHGHATAMLVLGGPVRGGRVHGRWPGLGREQLYEGRDLAVTTDFRAALRRSRAASPRRAVGGAAVPRLHRERRRPAERARVDSAACGLSWRSSPRSARCCATR